jgi:hypothetical protein
MSFATWDAATSSWRTSQQSLFEDSMPFSGRWPKAGSMHAGAVSERPMLARHISEIAGGVSPGNGRKWATPEAMNFDKPMTEASPQDSIGAQARRWTASAWPTPAVSSGAQTAESPTPGQTGGTTLKGAARMLWPTPYGFNGQGEGQKYGGGVGLAAFVTKWATPRATDADHGGPNQRDSAGNPALPAQAHYWATPAAGVFNDSETPESWRARAERLRQKHQNGNGAGVPLAIQAQEHGRDSRPAPTTGTDGGPSSNGTPTSRLQLNARFVEVLMGLRPGWTDFEDSGTPSCHSKQRPPCEPSGSAPSERCRDA